MTDGISGEFPLTILISGLALAATLVLAWLVLKFIASTYKTRIASSEIQVKSSYSLGAKQHLYVVSFRKTDYLLGVTGENIQILDRYPEENRNEELESSPQGAVKANLKTSDNNNTGTVYKL